MKYYQSFQYALMPDGEKTRQMRRYAGSCRFVFNKALALQKERYERGEKILGYAELCKLLTEWKNNTETPWLKEPPAHPLQQTLKDLGRAYTNFFANRAELPRFKKKGQHQGLRFPDPTQIKLDQVNSRIFLPKLGWMRYRKSREVLGTVNQVIVSEKGGDWFVSIQAECEKQPLAEKGDAIGIDMGIVRFATLSNRTFYKPLSSFKKHETALRKAQQSLSRKEKFSKNWKKAKARVQRIHIRIGNVRRDYLHKATTTISKKHAIVCIEDLKVGNMSKSAAGNAESPGKNVRAKSQLNKAILDQGWFEFRRQLDYKMAWTGGRLIAVPPHNTSRECPACHHISGENRKTQDSFICVSCDFQENADVVGAIIVLARGMKVLLAEGQDMAHACARWNTTAQIACEVSGK